MTTPRQIEANQRNAKRSSGPKTGPGKVAASRNALRHGLLAKEAMLYGESSTDFFAFTERLQATLQPVGELECTLVGRIGSSLWRLKRLPKIESGILMLEQARMATNNAQWSDMSGRPAIYDRDLLEFGEAFARGADSLAKLSRYETTIERSVYKAIHELQRLQAARKAEQTRAPLVLEIDATKNHEPANEREPIEDGW